MIRRTISKGRLALIGLPMAGAILLGTAGYAYAAGTDPGPPPTTTTQGSTATGGTSSSASEGAHKDSKEHNEGTDGNNGSETDDRPAYHSSVTTKSTSESGNEVANDLALTKLAKVDLAHAARAGAAAVPGGAAVGVELDNEGGNVVYTVDVVTSKQQTEVIVDAGTGHVLAKSADNDGEDD